MRVSWNQSGVLLLTSLALQSCSSVSTTRQAEPENLDPCLAHNPTTLLTHEFGREHGAPRTEVASFRLPISVPTCVDIQSLDTNGHRVTAGAVLLDGSSILAPRQFNQRFEGIRRAMLLAAGDHAFEVRLDSKPGTSIRITVTVPGPAIMSFAPVYGDTGTVVGLEGEGLYGPLRVTSGDQELARPTWSNGGRRATAVTVPGMAIRSLVVHTPFGTAETLGPFTPAEPRGVVRIYDRLQYPDAFGDGHPDIQSVAVVDDGSTVSIVIHTFDALPSELTATLRFRSAIEGEADRELAIGFAGGAAGTVPDGWGAQAVRSERAVVLAAPRSALDVDNVEKMGRFLLGVRLSAGAGSDNWPDSQEFADVQPIVAPRFLRFRAADPDAVARRHGGVVAATDQESGISLLLLPAGRRLDEALQELIEDPEVVGSFPEFLAYAQFSPQYVGRWVTDLGCAGAPAGFPVDDGSAGMYRDVITQWNLNLIRAPQAWNNAAAGHPRGAGIKVIIADSGLRDHEELQNAVDFANALNLLPSVMTDGSIDDRLFHGTAMSSVIAARSNNGGMAGVAPDATLVPFKVLARNRATLGFVVARAFSEAMRLQERDPSVKVLNMSLAYPVEAEAALLAILGGFPGLAAGIYTYRRDVDVAEEAARRMVVSASAGNSREWPILSWYGSTYPATVDGVLSVGAVGVHGAPPGSIVEEWVPTAAADTTQDEGVDLAAPGDDQTPGAGIASPTKLICTGGTSAAAAHVSGAAAVLSSIPGMKLNPQQIGEVLVSTTMPIPEPHDLVGSGVLRLDFAVESALRLNQGLPSRNFSGITRASIPEDSTFAGNVAYFLMPNGESVAREVPPLDPFSPVSHGLGHWTWLLGDPQVGPAGHTLWGGALGQSSVFRVLVQQAGLPSLRIDLPAPVVGKPIIVAAPRLPSGQDRFLLVPTTRGLYSVSLKDESFHLSQLIAQEGIEQIAVSEASLPSSAKRLVLAVSARSGHLLKLFDYIPLTNTAQFLQDTEALPFAPDALAVANVPFGPAATSPTQFAEFPIWAAGGVGSVVITCHQKGAAHAKMLFNLEFPEVSGLVAAHERAEIYVVVNYNADRNVRVHDPRRSGPALLIKDLHPESPVLPSLSADGKRMAFVNTFLRRPDEDAEPEFYTLTLEGL